MNINLKSEKTSFDGGANDERNDSLFQKEGEYIINKKPKFKYVIRVVHTSPNRIIKKSQTQDRIMPSIRFTFLNNEKLNQINKKDKTLLNKNRNIINNLYKNKSPRTGPTIRFLTGALNTQREIKNNNYENLLKNSLHYIKYNKLKESKEVYNNKKDKIKYNYANEFNSQYEYDNEYDYDYDNDCDYTIEIFPAEQCTCKKEIIKIINQYFENNKIINKYKYNPNNDCSCDRIFKRKKIKLYNPNMENEKNNYNNLYSPPPIRRKKYFKKQFTNKKSLKYLNYLQNEDIHDIPYNNIQNDNYYYDINSCKNKNNIYKKINSNQYNNNVYHETSYISSPKNNKNLKKIRISKNNNNTSNNSFISVDNSKNKNLSPNNNSFINQKNYIRKTYCSPNIKSQNTSKNTTNKFNERKSNNNTIKKSSERYEKIKIVPLGQKIQPLLVKKSVEKPIKEKKLNKDGSTTNIIKQNSVITSIETKPIINRNSKDKNIVKEYITKIYTTLIRDNNEIDDKNDNIILNNNNKEKNDELLKEINIKNYNQKDFDVKNDTEKNINIDNNYQFINNINNKDNNKNSQFNNIYLNNENKKDFSNNNIDTFEINDLLIHKNKNSSFNYSSLYSNINDPNEQSNIGRINEIVRYIKYLYYRYTNLSSYENAKEESLFNYFIKLSEEEKKAVLNNLNDDNIENQKIYNKLISFLDGNIDKLISNEENEKNNKIKQSNILFKKKIIK